MICRHKLYHFTVVNTRFIAPLTRRGKTKFCHGTFEIVPQEVLWSIWGSHQTLWSLPLPNVTWHSGTWPYTMTPSVDQTLHQFANLLPNRTLIPILTLLPNFGGFHRTLQRVRLANRGRLLLRTPGPVPFGTCICSYVETILSWTCHVYGPFEFRTSLGTSILLCDRKMIQFMPANHSITNVLSPNNQYNNMNCRYPCNRWREMDLFICNMCII